jgi:proteasome activator subunit 4
VPSAEEIDFIIEVLDTIAGPALDKIEALLARTEPWDNVARNDFCRYLHAVRALWSGLPTLIKLDHAADASANTCADAETEAAGLVLRPLGVAAGFALTDPADPRHARVRAHRARFGAALDAAARFLRAQQGGEDHIDAVMATLRGADVYMLEYGMTRGAYDALRKNYGQARECVAGAEGVCVLRADGRGAA